MWQFDFIEHAKLQYPKECCGLLIEQDNDMVYVPCRNSAPEPENDFIIHPADLSACEFMGDILGICHSHPDSTSNPSLTDLAKAHSLHSEYPKADWYIFSWPEGDLHAFTPSSEPAPLIGRQFVHGVWDCYTLVRDYYSQELKITLPDYERQDGWWEGDQELYLENFKSAGFKPVSTGSPDDLANFEFKVGDVVLMQIRSKRVNHAAVYIGDSKIIHHMYGKPSKTDVYGGFWLRHTRLIIRHESKTKTASLNHGVFRLS